MILRSSLLAIVFFASAAIAADPYLPIRNSMREAIRVRVFSEKRDDWLTKEPFSLARKQTKQIRLDPEDRFLIRIYFRDNTTSTQKLRHFRYLLALDPTFVADLTGVFSKAYRTAWIEPYPGHPPVWVPEEIEYRSATRINYVINGKRYRPDEAPIEYPKAPPAPPGFFE